MKNRWTVSQIFCIILSAMCVALIIDAVAQIFGLELTIMDYVAIITAFASLAALFIKAYKDGVVISGIKEDTNDVRPKVDTIKNVVESTQVATTNIAHSIDDTKATTKETDRKVQELVNELYHQQQLRQSVHLPESKETFFAQIEQLYEQLAAYKAENTRLNNEQLRWIERNNQLMIENTRLQKRLERYEPKAVTPPIEPEM